MARTRRVLMLVENMSVPADPRVWREARALRQQGLQVSIICPIGEQRDQEPYICLEGIYIYRYKLSTQIRRSSDYFKEYAIALFMTFWLSLVVYAQHGFDVIHAANPPDIFFLIGLLYRPFGKKYIFDQHDLAPEIFSVKFKGKMKLLHWLLLRCERCSYWLADAVITTNESQKQMAIQRGKCDPKKVVVVRNGPELSRFPKITPDPTLKHDKRHSLVYVGVMGVQDGVDLALHALNSLVHKSGRDDVQLTLLGDGEQLPRLRQLTSTLELDEYVHFTGWVPFRTMLDHLAVADVGLCPDPSNELNDHSTMLKTMEYMAMSLPIVAFDLPETRYSAQDAALYATANDVEEFAEKLQLLLGNTQLRRELGAYGRKRVEEVLCWDRTKKALWRAYHRLFPLSIESDPEVAESSQTIETISPQLSGQRR